MLAVPLDLAPRPRLIVHARGHVIETELDVPGPTIVRLSMETLDANRS